MKKQRQRARRKVTPLVRIMWALPWCSYSNEEFPHPAKRGAWMICATKELAYERMIHPRQKPVRVRVTINPNTAPQGRDGRSVP